MTAPAVFVSGMVASGTSSTSFTVSAATGSGDTLVVAVTVAGASSPAVSSVTDSQGNTYTLLNSSAGGSPFLYAFQAASATALTTADTVTAHYSGSLVIGLDMIGADCPGYATVDVNTLSSGFSTSASATGTPGFTGELALAAFAWQSAGGTGTPQSPLTQLSQGQITGNAYTTLAYALNPASGFTAKYTIGSTNWRALLITLEQSSGTHSGTAALSGTGTLGGTGVFAGTAALSGSGTLGGTPTHLTSHGHGTATLDGNGTLGGTATGTFFQVATLDGEGTLTASWTGVLAQPPVTLSGTGNLNVSGVKLGFTATLSGSGTIFTLATGGLVFGTSIATPYAYPLASQVMVAPPGTASWVPLGSIGVMTALTYSFTCPGGADQMTATIMVPASYRTQYFNVGWQVRITRGGHKIWDGKLDEPVPTAQGWNLTASGTGNRGQDYLAIYTSGWPANQPDESINNAIARGLPWNNTAGIGTPAGAWFGQAVDSGAQTITALLNLICTRGGLTWYVNSQPGGYPGDDLKVFPLPTVPNRLLLSVSPAPRTLGGDINTIHIRYQVTAADSTSGGSGQATFGLTSVQNTQSVTAHGVMETYIDLSDVGTMTQAAAQAVGTSILAIYQRASFAGPFTASYGQLMTSNGAIIDPGTDQAGTMVKLILTDFGYGGEVTPQFPLTFIVGSYAWNDLTQVAQLTPYVTVDASLTGLLSLANTELTPITAA